MSQTTQDLSTKTQILIRGDNEKKVQKSNDTTKDISSTNNDITYVEPMGGVSRKRPTAGSTVHMLSRASEILTLVPKHSQSSNDEESSDSSSEVENFNLQKRDSTESSSAPSLPSSLENLHILSDDENNLTSCPTVSMKPASESISLDSSTQDSLHSVIPPSPTAIVNFIRNKKPRFNRIVPETPESSPAIVAASPSPSNINTCSKQPRLAVRRLAPIQRKQLKFHWNNKKFEHNAEIHDKQLPSDTIKHH
ncbi:unnamed protein product [Pieris brassicae]|uniref:Uncharacterized protein n=1 Tax=Pieris brassicae TaxID=7116 RepID=A0A9P0TXE8_PIEBR|nr:unnamed protein product [Pieris brassicae]